MPTRFQVHSPGVRELLAAPAVRAELERLARKAAASITGRDEISVEMRKSDRRRAVARIVDTEEDAIAHEARHGTLTRSLDAL